EHLAAVPVDMRVRGAAVHVRDGRIVGEVVPIHAPEAPARAALGHEPLRLDVAALEIDGAVREAERADVTVAVESRGPLVVGRRAREVALDAIERALDVRRDLPPHLAVVNIRFEPRRAVEAPREHRMPSEVDRHAQPPPKIADGAARTRSAPSV